MRYDIIDAVVYVIKICENRVRGLIMMRSSFAKIACCLLFLNCVWGLRAAEAPATPKEPVSNTYEDPGKWQRMPEKAFFFSVDGMVNNSYLSSEIDTSASPLKDYIATNEWKKVADFCENKSEIKKGMIAHLLAASGTEKIEIDEFRYDVPPFALFFNYPEKYFAENGQTLFVVSQKPIKNIAILSQDECSDDKLKARFEKELRQFFASDTSFIPILPSLEEGNPLEVAKSLEKKELEKFIEQKMRVQAVKVPSGSMFKDINFVRGEFEVWGSPEEDSNYYAVEFSAVFLPGGNLQVIPNFEIQDLFKIDDKLYFWGLWSYPETGWIEYRIFKIEGDQLVMVFEEDGFAD